MRTFAKALRVEGYADASAIAGELFQESFGSAFPVPCDLTLAGEKITRADWRQYVAFYTWPDATTETVGFCNWIRCGEVVLGGGMCVKRGFYRRLPAPELKQCSARGGVAQIMLEAATNDMQDSLALFGYCGDRQAFVVDTRAGYLPTLHPHLIVKWIADVPALRRREIEDRIAAVGPF